MPALRNFADEVANQWGRLGFAVQIEAAGADDLANRLATGRFRPRLSSCQPRATLIYIAIGIQRNMEAGGITAPRPILQSPNSSRGRAAKFTPTAAPRSCRGFKPPLPRVQLPFRFTIHYTHSWSATRSRAYN